MEARYTFAIIGVEPMLALYKPSARSRQGITGDMARIKDSLRPFFQPPNTCDPSGGPVRVARPLPWRAAATPVPHWSTGRIHGHSRFKTPDRVVH